MKDYSLPALVGANILALLVVLAMGMHLLELMLVYWVQSVIIGIASFVRIVCLKKYCVQRGVAPTMAGKFATALVFLAGYGFFHLGYFMFLTIHLDRHHDIDYSRAGVLLCALVFAVNHGYTLLQGIRLDATGRPMLNTLLVFPFLRIVPMHVTIVFGGLYLDAPWAFPLFVALKIAVDALMHVVEERLLARER